MNKICYLRHEDNHLDLDKLLPRELDAVTLDYDIAKVPSLVTFTQREKTLDNQDYFLVDLNDTAYSTSHILSAVQYLRKFSQAKLIVIAPDTDDTTNLFGCLASQYHENNLIKGTVHEDTDTILTKIKEALEGKSHALGFVQDMLTKAINDVSKTVSPLTIPENISLTIKVGGTQERVGTTTQLISAYTHLKALGFKPAILDPDETLINMIWNFCPENHRERTDDKIDIFGITFITAPHSDHNVILTDCGVVNDTSVQDFTSADLSILTCCTKPWEIPKTIPCIKLCYNYTPKKLWKIASFSHVDDVHTIESIVGDMTVALWRPNIWTTELDGQYQKALIELLKPMLEVDH